MTKWLKVALVFAVFSIASCRMSARSTDPSGDSLLLAQGKTMYTIYCQSCHGSSGDGKGPAAYLLFPKPRNFLKADFKLHSTLQGKLPTDEDLIRVVSQGIPGTAMFAFGDILSDVERQAVVEYVKSFAPRFKKEAAADQAGLLRIPAAPPPTPELIQEGRQTYDKFGCGKCHGPEGRGDGPSAPTLVDSSGDPFPAADFSRGIHKSGDRPGDLYRTFLTGMNGTPMPSFQGSFANDEQAWSLVYYILSLAPGGKAQPIAGDPGPLTALPAPSATLDDPDSEYWDKLAPHRVYMRPLWYRNTYPLFIRVRAATADGRIGLMVEWDDPSHNQTVDREQAFADGVAAQFALTGKMPFIAMGDRTPEGLCELWFWRTDRQAAADTAKTPSRADSYPFMSSYAYPQPEYSSARDAGNPNASEGLPSLPVHNFNASGFGTLTAKPPSSQRANGRGRWKDGVYRVVFAAPMKAADKTQADFSETRVPVAFAVWDGNSGDRNGMKLVSQWLTLAPAGNAAISQGQHK